MSAATLPLAYVAPQVGSRVLIPSGLTDAGWLEVIVTEVRPHVGSRLPEIVGRPHGSLIASFRSVEWRAPEAVDVRCGTCYRVVLEGVTVADHAASSAHHASIAGILERAS
jgi:hypothetical protein